MKKSSSKAPEHLSADAQSWWQRIITEFELGDDAGLLLLQAAMESHDRAQNCRAHIERDGELVQDRFGQSKPHPLLAAERDARAQMLNALRQLNLDIEPLRDGPGRPPTARAPGV